MEERLANWIVFYRRNGEEVTLPFYFAGRPSLTNIVSKVRKHMPSVNFVVPYPKPGMTQEANANAFLFVNCIEGLVCTPFLNSEGDLVP